MGPGENLELPAQRQAHQPARLTARSRPGGTVRPRRHVQDRMDAEESEAVRAEGLDPDDPAVTASR
jgi:hypothetical protein